MAKKTAKAAATFNPFEQISTGAKSKKAGLPSIELKGQLAESIDRYADLHDQIKHLEGEKDVHKDGVTAEARRLFSERQMEGKTGNFHLLGKNSSVTFVVQNAGAALHEDAIKEISNTFGAKAAKALTEVDNSSIRFTKEFTADEANRVRLVRALGKEFSVDEMRAMFETLNFKVVADVVEKAPAYVKTADELDSLYAALKLKAFIKA